MHAHPSITIHVLITLIAALFQAVKGGEKLLQASWQTFAAKPDSLVRSLGSLEHPHSQMDGVNHPSEWMIFAIGFPSQNKNKCANHQCAWQQPMPAQVVREMLSQI